MLSNNLEQIPTLNIGRIALPLDACRLKFGWRELMTDKRAKFTPWTIPQSDWSPVLDDVDIGRVSRQELVEALEQSDNNALKERLRAFETQVSNETMSKLVK